MKRYLILLLLSVSLYSVSIAQSAKQYFKAGKEFAETGNHKDAILQFTKAIDLNPKDADYYLFRAMSYEQNSQLELAYDDYIRATSFDDDTKVRQQAGKVAYEMKNYDKALENLDKALVLKSTNNDAFEFKVKTYIALQNFQKAKEVCDAALKNKETATNFYLSAFISENLNNLDAAEIAYKKAISEDKKMEVAYIGLADILIRRDKLDVAMQRITDLMKLNPNNYEAYVVRSKVYVKRTDFPTAINDMSKAIIMQPENERLYFIRGTYYQQFTQQQNAINDYNKVLMVNNKNAEALYQRASCYEQVANYKEAIKDYEALAKLSVDDAKARKLLDVAKKRLFELNRETNSPEFTFIDPTPKDKTIIELPKNKKEATLKGSIKDQSEVESLTINGKLIPIVKNSDGYEFIAVASIDSLDSLRVTTTDVYKNTQNITFTIVRTEITPPILQVTAPFSSDNGEIYLDTNDPNLYVEGKVSDESLIKTILIDGVSASFKIDESNPTFSVNLNVANKAKITVTAIDIYGNKTDRDYVFNRQGASANGENPMGKTWVVFIENSNYQTFASLEGPVKDITLMKSALAKYKISNVIHKKDMTKKDMEKFFSIELRDMVRSNRVNAIMVWYAGHGKFINQTGYWIPVDANRDDEFTYFNINTLKASIQGYTNLTHTLIITDACESGPTFYQAMRSTPVERDCGDWKATKFKSSQVFSSAGYELAADNSQFTKTFANSLANNPNVCIPIENIVLKVTNAVAKNSKQKPQFGKIAGLEDEDGTFFFITK